MLTEEIIEPDTFQVSGDRVSVSVRMPWYRGLPLSSIGGIEFSIDGAVVPTETLTFTVEGETYTLAELAGRYDKAWYVLDSATVEGELPDLSELSAGPDHEVSVLLNIYIPYLTVADDVMMIRERDTKTLKMKEIA
ncbi:DUF6379 domain-containing protein [Paenarthrobacter sp. TYUT067]|uniref:C-glycoside deglycosidase beta subunit domain-containing protein n=1 Tax=Paenarthrobacter sp. TYUT067 TaxID=2926245 RepID=UPI00202E8CA2|nr:DUF6379 domain-containing protein [Paenarthrobacter sp. TYUT067]MCM0616831.1 DUF6379 domain-containing protein [Paenarthrobacter sp. TYUT067]